MNLDAYKRAAAAAAVELVRSGMRLGLGTGSTAAAFLDLLAE
ncbi:MAG: ribose 5-phosphate isomerase A, partial [Xanthobacteraceae bacterium]